MDKSRVQQIKVKESEDIQKLALAIPGLLRDIDVESRYVPVLTSGVDQALILTQNGEGVISYAVNPSNSFSHGEDRPILGSIEKFLDDFDERKHLVILYDDPKVARSLEFRYLKTGLEKKGQQCIYVFSTDDPETPLSISKQMEEYGIDVTYYLKNGLLKFVGIEDPVKDPQGFLAGALRNVEKISSQITRPPVRVVAHQKYQFTTNEEILGEYNAEAEVEAGFENFPGSLLCNHYVGEFTHEGKDEWAKKMIQAHDGVLMACSA